MKRLTSEQIGLCIFAALFLISLLMGWSVGWK